jgi:hypothetical protein
MVGRDRLKKSDLGATRKPSFRAVNPSSLSGLKHVGLAMLLLSGSPSMSQEMEELGRILSADITAAMVRTESWLEADPHTVTISGCNIQIEEIYGNTCNVTAKVKKIRLSFLLNDVQTVDVNTSPGRALLVLKYRPELRTALKEATSIYRSMFTGDGEDPKFARAVRERIESFLEERSISYQGIITYCKGAEVPALYPWQNAQIYIDPNQAPELSSRLASYVKTYCPRQEES